VMNDSPKILVKILKPEAQLPKKLDKGSSGFDLFSIEDKILFPGERSLFKLGIALEIPEGFEAQIRSRSGLCLKHGILVLNSPGTIDSSYRGEIGIILYNTSQKKYQIQKGDRIAQMVFQKVPEVSLVQTEEIKSTERGANGFGSTGK
jgi:dUTP pyrophosphatase